MSDSAWLKVFMLALCVIWILVQALFYMSQHGEEECFICDKPTRLTRQH